MTHESELLSPAEVKDAAGGKASVAEQTRVFTELGLPHKVVGKRVLVSRHHLREWLAGRVVAPSRAPKLELVK
jgi:hypothetical protein